MKLSGAPCGKSGVDTSLENQSCFLRLPNQDTGSGRGAGYLRTVGESQAVGQGVVITPGEAVGHDDRRESRDTLPSAASARSRRTLRMLR